MAQKLKHLRGNIANDVNQYQRGQTCDDVVKEKIGNTIERGEIAINEKGLPKLYVKNGNDKIQKFVSEQYTNEFIGKKLEKKLQDFRPSHATCQDCKIKIGDNAYVTNHCRSCEFGLGGKEFLYELKGDWQPRVDGTIVMTFLGEYINFLMNTFGCTWMYIQECPSNGEHIQVSIELSELEQNDFRISYRKKNNNNKIRLYVMVPNTNFTNCILWNRKGSIYDLIEATEQNKFGIKLVTNWIVNVKKWNESFKDGCKFATRLFECKYSSFAEHMDFSEFIGLMYDCALFWRGPGNGMSYRWKTFFMKRGYDNYNLKNPKTTTSISQKVRNCFKVIGRINFGTDCAKTIRNIYVDFALFNKSTARNRHTKIDRIGAVYRVSVDAIYNYNRDFDYYYLVKYDFDNTKVTRISYITLDNLKNQTIYN